MFSEGKSNVLFKAHFLMVRRGINLLDNNIHMMRICVLVHYNNITVNRNNKNSKIFNWGMITEKKNTEVKNENRMIMLLFPAIRMDL